MEQKHIFIIKPNTQSPKIEAMINSLMKGYDYEIKYTKYSRHATEIAKSYQKV